MTTIEKKDRNSLIIKEIIKGDKSLQQIADIFGLRAKSTVHSIYKRALKNGKYGVHKLSTGKTLTVRK